MKQLTTDVFAAIHRAVTAKATELGVSGVLAVSDRMTGVIMYDFVNCGFESAIREDKDGGYNILAIALSKAAMATVHGTDTGNETNIAGEVKWKGGHISKDGQSAYGFSGAKQDEDDQLTRVAEDAHAAYQEQANESVPKRRHLPDERHAVTHKFDIEGHEGYITVGLYENDTPGEIFLVIAKEGSTISGFADAFAQAVSYALQYGVPLRVLIDKFTHMRFEPSGRTKNPDIRIAKSVVDYVFRWMKLRFLGETHNLPAGVGRPESGVTRVVAEEGPPCRTCGVITLRSGSMWKCVNCGLTQS